MKLGVLLIGMGGPDALEDVPAYLDHVRDGRPVSPEFLKDLVERYRRIGGGSPYLRNSRAQAEALEACLAEQGLEAAVEVGMRHWRPFVRDGLARLLERGARRLIGIPLAPHPSWTVDRYRELFELAASGEAPSMPRAFVLDWSLEPGFIEAAAEKVGLAASRLRKPTVLFTAHSLPVRLTDGGYVAQLRGTAEAVAGRLDLADWRLAFQSASPSKEPWLGPELGETMRELAARGVRELVLAPIGFICDHLEVLYDLDVQFRAEGEALGLKVERAATVGAHPALIRGWAEMVLRVVPA